MPRIYVRCFTTHDKNLISSCKWGPYVNLEDFIAVHRSKDRGTYFSAVPYYHGKFHRCNENLSTAEQRGNLISRAVVNLSQTLANWVIHAVFVPIYRYIWIKLNLWRYSILKITIKRRWIWPGLDQNCQCTESSRFVRCVTLINQSTISTVNSSYTVERNDYSCYVSLNIVFEIYYLRNLFYCFT